MISEYYETLQIFFENNEMLSLEALGWNKELVSAFRQYSGPFDSPEKWIKICYLINEFLCFIRHDGKESQK